MTVILKGDLPTEERKCRNKQQYYTRKAAKHAAKRKRGVTLHVYRCQYCACFHLTRSANDDKWDGKLAPRAHSPQNWNVDE